MSCSVEITELSEKTVISSNFKSNNIFNSIMISIIVIIVLCFGINTTNFLIVPKTRLQFQPFIENS